MPTAEWRKDLARGARAARALAELEAPGRRETVRVARARKVLFGCVDCGYNKHPEALQFDHRPGVVKTGNISQWSGSIDSLIAEMDKCDVVCANCHAIRTAIRRDEKERITSVGFKPDRNLSQSGRLGQDKKSRGRINQLISQGEIQSALDRLSEI